jgi:hypothetical protein
MKDFRFIGEAQKAKEGAAASARELAEQAFGATLACPSRLGLFQRLL